MKTNTKNDLIMQNKVFLWLALGTAAILSLPYMAMQFNLVKPDPNNPNDVGVSWGLEDFIAMAILLFGAGSLFILIARLLPSKYRFLIAFAVLALFLWLWAELAVGVFTNIGS